MARLMLKIDMNGCLAVAVKPTRAAVTKLMETAVIFEVETEEGEMRTFNRDYIVYVLESNKPETPKE